MMSEGNRSMEEKDLLSESDPDEESEVLSSAGQGKRSQVGRPTEHSYPSYFKRTGKTGICQVKKSRENTEICGKLINTWCTRNLSYHLEKFHPNEFAKCKHDKQQLDKDKSEAEQKKQKLSQASLSDFFTSKNRSLMPKTSAEYKSITAALATFAAKPTQSFSVVEDEDFLKLMEAANPKYPVPSTYLVKQEVKNKHDKLSEKIAEKLGDARKINLTADIWSKPGMTQSFLGVTAHFFGKSDNRRYRILLAVREMSIPHTGKMILDALLSVLNQWVLDPRKILKTVTDGGANIVKAFEHPILFGDEDDHVISEASNPDPETEPDPSAFVADPNLDESFGENDDKMLQALIDAELVMEEQLEDAFTEEYFLSRLLCVAHKIQCVVRDFDKSQHLGLAARTKGKKIIAFFRKSHIASKRLQEVQANVKKPLVLIGWSPTRWSSSYLAFRRLLQLKSEVSRVVEELSKIDDLTNSEWKAFECYCTVLKPFSDFTHQLEGENYTSISLVMPYLRSLDRAMSNFLTDRNLRAAASKLLKHLSERFAFILDVRHSKFEPFYSAATFLHPPYHKILSAEQEREARLLIEKAVREYAEMNSGDPEPGEAQRNDAENESDDLLDNLDELLASSQSTGSSVLAATEEIDRFVASNRNLGKNAEPADFWIQQSVVYPNLHHVALDILSCTATSAPAERVFSQCSIACKGTKGNISTERLEQSVMLRCNKYLVE